MADANPIHMLWLTTPVSPVCMSQPLLSMVGPIHQSARLSLFSTTTLPVTLPREQPPHEKTPSVYDIVISNFTVRFSGQPEIASSGYSLSVWASNFLSHSRQIISTLNTKAGRLYFCSTFFSKLICTFSNFLFGIYAGPIARVRTLVVTQQ